MDSHPWTKESPEGTFECWCGAACDGVRRPDRDDPRVILQTVCVNGRVCCDYSPDQVLAALRTGVHQFSKGVMP